MRDRGGATVQEGDEENDVHQETINRGLTDCVEPSRDGNQNAHSIDVVGNGMSHRISHIISQSSGRSCSYFRSSISGTPYDNPQG